MNDSHNHVPDYSRQKSLTGFGDEGQARLAAAKVLILGAGGLGSSVIPLLAGAGNDYSEKYQRFLKESMCSVWGQALSACNFAPCPQVPDCCNRPD